jgi:transposase-like protein
MAEKQPRGPGGRPSKLTDTLVKLVVIAISKGAGREDAAEAAGIHPSTFRRWMAEAASGEESEFSAFRAAVEGAESELVRRAGAVLIDMLAPEVSESVRFAAAKLILERRRPDVWGARAAVRIEGAAGGPVQVEHSGAVAVEVAWERLGDLTPEQLEALGRGLTDP